MKGQISNFAQVASVRRMTVTSGAMQDLKIIDCDNGKLRFILNESKALDIMQVYHEGQNVSFISKNGFTSKNRAFLGRFEGGMLYTCGLDAIGGVEGVDLHGTFHNNKADVFRAECNENGIVVEAYIYNTQLFGRNLKMHRKIFSAIGSETLTLEDKLINCGYGDEDYCLLYHVNVGYPLLDDGAKVVADIAKCDPRNDWAKERVGVREVMSDAVPLEDETCYFLTLNKPEASLVNEKVGKKFTLRYSAETLPCFVQWKSMASGDYALGLEPATSKLDLDLKTAKIKAGETIDFRLDLSVTKL